MLPCHKGRSKLQKPTFQNTAESKSLKHGTIESVQQGANYLTGKLHHKTAQVFHTIFKKEYTRQLGKNHIRIQNLKITKAEKTMASHSSCLSKQGPNTATAKTKIQSKSRKEKKKSKKESAECN
jgi:hypothetical protein